ncbi:MAG: signal recognition particle-docking protein FtsY [Thermoplasmata archaeon]|nr:signal recognition particle-docking protein FtsY [Thermoplasmata archaeon]
MFRALRDFFKGTVKRVEEEKPVLEEVVGEEGKRIRKGALDEILEELQMELLSADVALPVAEEIIKKVGKQLFDKKYDRGYRLDDIVELALRGSLKEILSKHRLNFWKLIETTTPRPVVLMFVGVNGTGKTSIIAKLTKLLTDRGFTSVLAAGDTFRAGAIEQISIHADKLGTRLIKHQAGSDPAAVAFDAIEHAKARKRDVVLIDTAGRMQTNRNLMDEMKKIKKVAQPNLIIFVGDSLTGSDAIEQAREFDTAVGVDAIILTKIDADAKGGAAISISSEIGKPVIFVSNGQEYDNIMDFDPDWMIQRIFEDKE